MKGSSKDVAYIGREQTEAKHFILRGYLQALAFKVLNAYDIAYVDGFSGPWETKTGDFSDTSFMIAINVLRDAQLKIFERTRQRRHIRCFFSEKDPKAFAQLRSVVAPFHDPASRFEIRAYHGEFESAVSEIRSFVGNHFPLIFIDPTGWTGYRFDKTAPLFAPAKCEVLINFMYEFVNRFSHSDDEETIASLDPILGGPGWRNRLDQAMPRGMAVEKLFRETLKAAGKFRFAVSAKIDKPTKDRPHFFLAYATKHPAGLKEFRQTEYDALRMHARNRVSAKEREREKTSKTGDLFAGHEADVQEENIEDLVAEQMTRARDMTMSILAERGSITFDALAVTLMEAFMLRETNIKEICVELAKAGTIVDTWGGGNHRPKGNNLIKLQASSTR
jgi:three-Cys-motif partner protein